MHAKANAKIRHLAFAGKTGRENLALGAAFAKAAGHHDAVDVFEIGRRVFGLEDLRFNPFEIDLHAVGDAAMGQRLDQGFVGVLEAGVLAHHRNGDFAFGIVDALGDGVPARHIGLGRGLDAKRGQHFAVKPGLVIGLRHIVNRADVAGLDHGALAHVAEQAELAALVARHRAIRAAQQNIRLDADGAQLFHRMLRRLGLQFPGGGNVGQQRQMHVDAAPARQIIANLADRLEERQALDVADRAADLDQHEIDVVALREHEFLDVVGDVRDHLHSAAKVIAAALLGDDLLIDAARGDVVGLARGHSREALIMSKIKIGFRPVVGDEHFAMLIGAHRARIDIQIGVEFTQANRVTTSLQERSKGRRRKPFPERRHHATGDEYIPRHGV